MPAVSVIISTYNNPAALQKSLWGYRHQIERDFEILVADDGSAPSTREVIQLATRRSKQPLQHIWHPDDGFRKSEILNKAILQARGDYLIFTDGDCIPRDDFVQAHRTSARPNRYLSGGSHIDVSSAIHTKLSEDDVAKQRVFDRVWLESQGMQARKYRWRLSRNKLFSAWLDSLTPRPGVLVGCNASAWKTDVLDVNGFDATSTYGSDDLELGARMTNNGIKSKRLKYSLICVHQSHDKSYSKEQIELNKRKLREIRAKQIRWIDNGLHQSDAA